MLSRMGTLHEFPELSTGRGDAGDSDLGFAVIPFLLWVLAVARVAAAVSAREVFGAEASLAFVCMVGLPYWALRSWLRKRAKQLPLQKRQPGAVVALRRRA
ncbi:MAG TPA: hypothetical protein VMI54_25190 [Polyangiaceae bacterium]|nr:hypothetical protein [Polyangiaceae bacterium]